MSSETAAQLLTNVTMFEIRINCWEKNMRHLVLLIAAFAGSAPALAQRNRQPEVSAEALKAMQLHEVTAPLDRVFPAVISAITDKNYSVDSANRDAGLITATENTKSKMGGMGLTTKQNTIKLSIVVTATQDGRAKVRVNAIDDYVYTYNGKKYRDENQPVTTTSVYSDIFAAIDEALR